MKLKKSKHLADLTLFTADSMCTVGPTCKFTGSSIAALVFAFLCVKKVLNKQYNATQTITSANIFAKNEQPKSPYFNLNRGCHRCNNFISLMGFKSFYARVLMRNKTIFF